MPLHRAQVQYVLLIFLLIVQKFLILGCLEPLYFSMFGSVTAGSNLETFVALFQPLSRTLRLCYFVTFVSSIGMTWEGLSLQLSYG